MNSDISEEAKKALANGARRRAADRLDRDGCHSMGAVRRRVLAFAQERNLQSADYAKLLHKRISSSVAVAFCEKHKVSMDWLLCGDLKGLQRTTKEARAAPPEMSEVQREEVTRLFLALTPQKQALALAIMHELITRSVPNGQGSEKEGDQEALDSWNSPLSVDSRTPFSDRGVLLEEHRRDLST
jgi:hypothetical protein